MRELLRRLETLFRGLRRYNPPVAPTGVTAVPGGGSGETQVTWDPVPGDATVAQYRVYKRHGTGTFELLAVVTHSALGLLEPGRFGIVDAPTTGRGRPEPTRPRSGATR